MFNKAKRSFNLQTETAKSSVGHYSSILLMKVWRQKQTKKENQQKVTPRSSSLES